MLRRQASAVVVVGALAFGTGVADRQRLLAQTGRSPFRASVDLVSLQVTVTDTSGRYVPDLTREDFTILEDGVPQKLAFFNPIGTPLALALLMDTSASMEAMLPTAQEAAIGFARQLEPDDLATIVDFDSRVQVLHDFTSDGSALEQAIRRTRAGGSTSLYNAVYIAVQELKKLRPETETLGSRRRAIVILSDGEDTSSLVSFEDVLDLAVRADTAIYAIGISPDEFAQRHGSADAQFVLRRLAQQTGGRAFFPSAIKDLADVYTNIRKELSQQYSLGYESTNSKRDGRWRRLAVHVARANCAARTRPGYFSPSK